MTTNAYAAKRAVIAALKVAASTPGTALNKYSATVLYAFNGATAGNVCVYGGGVVFDQPGDDDVYDGARNRITLETATVGIHIRVKQPPAPDVDDGGIEATDVIAEEIGEWLGDWLAKHPDVGGGHSVARVISGQGDYSPTEQDAVSILSYRIQIESQIALPST